MILECPKAPTMASHEQPKKEPNTNTTTKNTCNKVKYNTRTTTKNTRPEDNSVDCKSNNIGDVWFNRKLGNMITTELSTNKSNQIVHDIKL